MVSPLRSQSSEVSSKQAEQSPGTSQEILVHHLLHCVSLDDITAEFLQILLLLLIMKRLITMPELLHSVDHRCNSHFPQILRELLECICVCLGTHAWEVDFLGQIYVLVPSWASLEMGCWEKRTRSFQKQTPDIHPASRLLLL